jgi:hypothetical protein
MSEILLAVAALTTYTHFIPTTEQDKMNDEMLALTKEVLIIKSNGVMVATPMENDNTELCITQVMRAAKMFDLPITGWRRSEYTNSYVKEL